MDTFFFFSLLIVSPDSAFCLTLAFLFFPFPRSSLPYSDVNDFSHEHLFRLPDDSVADDSFRTVSLRQRHRLYIEKYQHDNRKTFTHSRVIRDYLLLNLIGCRSDITYVCCTCVYMCLCELYAVFRARARVYIYIYLIIHIYTRRAKTFSSPSFFFLFFDSTWGRARRRACSDSLCPPVRVSAALAQCKINTFRFVRAIEIPYIPHFIDDL